MGNPPRRHAERLEEAAQRGRRVERCGGAEPLEIDVQLTVGVVVPDHVGQSGGEAGLADAGRTDDQHGVGGSHPAAEKTSAYTEIVVLDDHNLLCIYDRIPHGWSAIPAGSADVNSVWVVRLTVSRTTR